MAANNDAWVRNAQAAEQFLQRFKQSRKHPGTPYTTKEMHDMKEGMKVFRQIMDTLPLGEQIHRGKRAFVEDFPTSPVSSTQVEEEEHCIICLGDYELNEKIHHLPRCNHSFHNTCIHRWLVVQMKCPYCRTPVSFDDMDRLARKKDAL